MKKLIRNLRMKLNLYTEQEVIVGLEFATILSDSARALDVVLTQKSIERAEEIYIKELKENGVLKTAINFIPLVMTIIEEDKKSPSN